jgi:methyl-accepting chemotaxis protein
VEISRTLKNIIGAITLTARQSDETDRCIGEMVREINTFAQVITEIITTFGELSDESREIAGVFDNLKEQTREFKVGYANMVSVNEKLVATMNDIASRRG